MKLSKYVPISMLESFFVCTVIPMFVRMEGNIWATRDDRYNFIICFLAITLICLLVNYLITEAKKDGIIE